MQFTSVNLIPHKQLQGRTERFASSDILYSSNQSLLDEVGGEGRGIYGPAMHGEKFCIFFVEEFAGVSPF